jgi:hypothetical protein
VRSSLPQDAVVAEIRAAVLQVACSTPEIILLNFQSLITVSNPARLTGCSASTRCPMELEPLQNLNRGELGSGGHGQHGIFVFCSPEGKSRVAKVLREPQRISARAEDSLIESRASNPQELEHGSPQGS